MEGIGGRILAGLRSLGDAGSDDDDVVDSNSQDVIEHGLAALTGRQEHANSQDVIEQGLADLSGTHGLPSTPAATPFAGALHTDCRQTHSHTLKSRIRAGSQRDSAHAISGAAMPSRMSECEAPR